MKKYFVIGNPIEHSLSPKLHNYWIKINNINAIYKKQKLNNHQLKDFFNNFKSEKIAGINVTVPFKKSVIPFLDKLSLEAEKTQSVNTIILDDGNLVGYNTDIFGFETAIKKINFNIQNKKALILGAGGVVPSIIYALKKMKVLEITISNRTIHNAENLKNYFEDLKVIKWGQISEFDIIINATSLGLNNESINLDFSSVGKNKLFFDVIYNPDETNFLKIGKKLGNITENGKLMFIYQAFEAFNLWHRVKPQIDERTIKILNND